MLFTRIELSMNKITWNALEIHCRWPFKPNILFLTQFNSILRYISFSIFYECKRVHVYQVDSIQTVSTNFISKHPNDYIKFEEIMNVVIVKCKDLMRNDRILWQLLILVSYLNFKLEDCKLQLVCLCVSLRVCVHLCNLFFYDAVKLFWHKFVWGRKCVTN